MKTLPVGLLLGFAVGAVLGIAWGQKAKGNMDKSVSVATNGGRVSVTFDSAEFVRAGLPGWLK